MDETPGDRGHATDEYRGSGRDRTDNWFNNGANKHPFIFSAVIAVAGVIALYFKYKVAT